MTGSVDRTVRVWSAGDDRLLPTIRLPQGPGNLGKIYAVAISPDGTVIAAEGWTRATHADPQEQVDLFDADTGEMLDRIARLPNGVGHLAFSPNGRRLAAILGGGFGLRFYDRETGWTQIAADAEYGDKSYGAAFAPDGRLATTSWDGKLRLYDPDGRLLRTEASGGAQPFDLAFNPDGTRLAVSFADSRAVRLFDGMSLARLPEPDTNGLDEGSLGIVAWSSDGTTLFAGGRYADNTRGCPVIARSGSGNGPRRALPAAHSAMMSLRALPGGDLLIAAADPWLGRISADGTTRWSKQAQQMDPRGQMSSVGLSPDGMVVDFGFGSGGEGRARFDLETLTLSPNPQPDGRTPRPQQQSLAITDWVDSVDLRLDGKPLLLDQYESSFSLAIDPTGERFLLGSNWALRGFDGAGAELWRRAAPGVVWAVNVSGDGRLGPAAYGDGTLRWHRMEDGAEILALFPLADRVDWVAWTPEGVYAASTGARSVLRWHVNNGWDAAGTAIPASEIPETHRPEVIHFVLPQLGTAGAIAAAELAKIRGAVQTATRAAVALGARLHVLAIGVGDYGEKAPQLTLDYADDDAHDLLSTLMTSQSGLYAEVKPQLLKDSGATRPGILRALATLRDAMARGDGNDLAVVSFSGHGAVFDDMFYLLPHDVDAGDPVAIRSSALRADEFQREIAALTDYGRVIVLIDACHSGATTGSGAALAGDADRLREIMRGPNVTVLTSSTADQISVENPDWQNGAFTEAVLEALTARADHDSNGLISMVEMTCYTAAGVPEITGGAQSPGIDTRFESNVFVAGL